jgi:hypothetical protein
MFFENCSPLGSTYLFLKKVFTAKGLQLNKNKYKQKQTTFKITFDIQLCTVQTFTVILIVNNWQSAIFTHFFIM